MAASQVSVSSEHPVSDPVYGRAAPGRQSLPAATSDGTNQLVVWEDGRSGTHVYGTRMTNDGAVLDPGIPITQAVSGTQHKPAIAFDGTNYFVVWEQGDADIYGTRVSRAGDVLDPAGIPISTASNRQVEPAIAFDGENYLVTWSDDRIGEYDIYAARVTPGGLVRDPGGIPISTAPGAQQAPAAAFDGANYLVAWGDHRSGADIFGARVARTGIVLDPGGIAISNASNDQEAPALVFGAGNYLVVWEDRRSRSDIYGARVTPAGAVLDPSGIGVSTGACGIFGCGKTDPAIAYDGTRYLVAWSDFRTRGLNSGSSIQGARVTAGGQVLDPNGIGIGNLADYSSAHTPAVTVTPSYFLAVWGLTDGPSPGGPPLDVFSARIGSDGRVLDTRGILISIAAQDQSRVAVGFDRVNYLAVFRESPGRTAGARVSRAGRALDGTGFSLPQGVRGGAIAFDGTNYLFAWGGCPGPRAARVTRAGAVLDRDGFPLSSDCSETDLGAAFGGTSYLVAWNRGGDIYAGRVNRRGTAIDPAGIPITIAANTQQFPAIAFDGRNYLVVWQDQRFGRGGPPDIFGARVAKNGRVLDRDGIRIAAAPGDQAAPAVAFDGRNYLVVWHDNRSGSSFDVYGARVSRMGRVLDRAGIPISTAPGEQSYPALAFDGATSLITWQDRRSGSSFDIFAAEVTRAGKVLDPTGVPISSESTDEQSPAVVGGEVERVAVAYERVAFERPYGGANRVFVRFVRGRAWCRVPKLVGRRLATARSRIRGANCRVGRVRRARSARARGRVTAQAPAAGAVRPRRTRVNLVVSRGRRR